MQTGDRVRLIFQTRDRLVQEYAEDDIGVVLGEFGIGGYELDSPYDITLAGVLRNAGDDDLLALSSYLFADAPPVREGPNDGPLIVFASHQSNHKVLVGQVADELKMYGITLFVAHVDIEPHATWRDEIIRTLCTAHAGVAFLHNEFKTSDWCDQEVGWLLGRGVPVITLKFDLAPYGPMGEKQAITTWQLHPMGMASAILDVLVTRPDVQGPLATSLAEALNHSRRFSVTDQIWSRIRNLRNLTGDQCARVLDAVENNDQVYRAASGWDEGRPYTELFKEFLREQPGYPEISNRLPDASSDPVS